MNLKGRLFGLLLILIFSGIIYYNWYELQHEGKYYLKAAAIAPVGLVGGIFLLFFPGMAGKPKSTGEKLIVMGVFAVGLIAGAINLYLMDPGMFGM
jgi:hypothetical protein